VPPAESWLTIDCTYADTVCLHAPVWDASGLLTAAESQTVRRAVLKRRREYATGRWLAHAALRSLGSDTGDLLNGSRREPLWPDGVTGSIAHTDGHAAVLVSRNPIIMGLGIDLEERNRLDPSLVPRILTDREQDQLNGADPTLLFSAKEAVYKLLYPLVREYVEFHAVEILLQMDSSTFSARYVGPNPACRLVERAAGSYLEIGGCWLTRVILTGSSTESDLAPGERFP
jgi:4'-phosphopantetheinyl transferase EntD